MHPLNELIERCRADGMRVTPQRIAVFECLRDGGGHLSAEEVFHQVRQRHPTLSFATVYNTLEMLTRLGEVREVIVDELRRRYDVNTEPHHHAVCRECHRIVDVRLDQSGAPWHGLPQADLSGYDFTVESALIEFAGLCGSCSRREAGSQVQGAPPP